MISTPLGTGLLRFKSGALCFDPARIGRPGPALFDPSNPALQAASVAVGGRQSAWFVSGEVPAAVLRHYRRGGLAARVSRDRYLWTGESSTRSFAEFRILQLLHGQGLRVPAPLAGAYWRAGPFYRAAILIERIPQVRTLAEALEAPQAVAQAIFAMHEAEVWHADLNAYNILLDKAGLAWLIDFDRARHGPVGLQARRSNLLRLRRSLNKVAGQRGLDCWVQIHRAYEALSA
ncbi:3-deoxy-D-manno-octulosonic acid kinase [Pusillimonas noertemannii]|uniref:3-deoxy-D-manno-octulosonic acid kinase n=1 Tax=Pusillimonas noertemannii TaxID=305977 RepID=A0A2U1CI19_9BURK|nr:3-deoxy-D-manno-octulosonic acid kinase [Pusillimonas noertemannii]NYT69537.1 3-deoxy-D-manno-octulosonic acid kinase [Pusillimonas noertemannii]PVY60571.1 3-deoxy-D-manno-octulosonic acid kinase [Pusillimonas noertemannii]TFL09919.1 3-deoxy-D-manno-octulosonic acid kinase [Pusillimonas noertemannii]